MKQEITQELIRNLFDYKNGILYWKINKSQGIQIGDKAGTLNNTGYYRISINYKQYLNHRLIFLYHKGYLPKQIDHIDGNPLNNKIENLRESNQSQNMMNSKPNKNTSSKYRGVNLHKSQKWISRIQINGKRIYLGLFKNEIDAALAYNKMAIKYYGEFAYLNEV